METYDLHIYFMDGKEEYAVAINEHMVRDNVLHCYVRKYSGLEYNALNRIILSSFPIHNIRKYIQE